MARIAGYELNDNDRIVYFTRLKGIGMSLAEKIMSKASLSPK
jgi:ribosomal protein S13